jgi:group I intron endonuclease
MSCGSPYLIHKAIRKYGWENFSRKVLFTTMDEGILKEKEKEFIVKLGTHCVKGSGYNMTDGGDGMLGFKFSEEQRERMRKSHLGNKLSEETKRKMSLSKKGRKNSASHNRNISRAIMGHPSYKKFGKVYTAEERQHISDAVKGKKYPNRKSSFPFSDEHKKNLSLGQQRRRARELASKIGLVEGV